MFIGVTIFKILHLEKYDHLEEFTVAQFKNTKLRIAVYIIQY